MKLKFLALTFIAIFLLTSCHKKKLFEKIDPSKSGISFSNRIIENDSINILSFDYVYNGAGVGVADFNNDGLQDLFFGGNQTDNKLFLNKGNFQFREVTDSAGVAGTGKWSSGVALIDINQDGLMDIYLAATSTNNSPSEFRENTLFVNQGLLNGIPIFKEMGEEYGINDNGHSENASFFDYDNDGDLDLYVLTNRIDQYPNQFRKKNLNGENPNTDRLYRNDWSENLGHPYFTNVSKEAGILIEGFGLGMNVTDINQDGWKDLYISNDYVSSDIIYINNQDGTFTNRVDDYLKHTSHSAMGNDIADINNDGLADIVVLDMVPRDNYRKKMFNPANNHQFYKFSERYGYTYQYMRNTLQLNNGKGLPYSEISLHADVAETDWSWSPSLADFDNDGFRDLLITNGFPKDVTDKDFMTYRAEIENLMARNSILEKIPSVKISNYAFRNTGDLSFEDVSQEWGIDFPSFSNGAVYADLDNDGDLDYIVNNINDSAFVYQNNIVQLKADESHYIRCSFKGSRNNRNGIGAFLQGTFEDGSSFYYEHNPYRGYKSSVELFAHIGLGTSDTLSELNVIWPNGRMQNFTNIIANQVLKLDIVNANLTYAAKKEIVESIFEEEPIDYFHEELEFLDYNYQNLIPFRISQMGPALAAADVNGDSLDDIFIGGSIFKSGHFLIQKKGGGFDKIPLLTSFDSLTKVQEDIGVLLFDVENDGDNDLYIVSGGNEGAGKEGAYLDRLYLNDGLGNFSLDSSAIPIFESAGSCVRAADYDQDGDLDLFIAGRNVPHKYPKSTSSYLLRNDSELDSVVFTDVTESVIPDLLDAGLICDGLWTDYDQDGDFDLMVAGDFMAITLYENRDGDFVKLEGTGLEKYQGVWNSLSGADFDLDGDIDYIAGNIGNNSLFKGTLDFPAVILSEDFDDNGIYDVLPFVPFRDENGNRTLVPYNAREDLNKQLNPIRTRFKTFGEYTKATIENVLSEEELNKAQRLELNYVYSSYIENLGNGSFRISPLPTRAQFSTVNGILLEDFTGDGFTDILLQGNNFGNELHVGRFDAQNGLLLVNDKLGGFIENWGNGFAVTKDAKALISYADADGNYHVMASQNQGNLKSFSSHFKVVVPPKGSKLVKYEFEGLSITRELYNGSSYLSQSGKGILMPDSATSIEWVN